MKNLVFLFFFAIRLSLAAQSDILCGDERPDIFLPLLKDKKVGVLVNQTAVVNGQHLIDYLLDQKVDVVKIFAPEHGFRGEADNGEHVGNTVDAKTGLHIISLYGSNTKPTPDELKDIDVVVFDIQDVGTRCYTFISTLHYVMEACAENNKQLIVLDRPNPNGWYIDGPVLNPDFKSFVGMDPMPLVYGLTVGEYANMAAGERWFNDAAKLQLVVVPCLYYTHSMHYKLPIKPSPNLPNNLAIKLYPSLCFFEGTNISVGRGTDKPFQVIGAPKINVPNAIHFTPLSKPGARTPPYLNKQCIGTDLTDAQNRYPDNFTFQYVIDMYKASPDKNEFFLKTGFFDKLCGTDEIRKMIQDGKTNDDIKAWYKRDLDAFKAKRKKYLLYLDIDQ